MNCRFTEALPGPQVHQHLHGCARLAGSLWPGFFPLWSDGKDELCKNEKSKIKSGGFLKILYPQCTIVQRSFFFFLLPKYLSWGSLRKIKSPGSRFPFKVSQYRGKHMLIEMRQCHHWKSVMHCSRCCRLW